MFLLLSKMRTSMGRSEEDSGNSAFQLFFFYVSIEEDLTVRQTTGVGNFVYFLDKPAIICDKEMQDVQHHLQMYNDLETISIREMKVGDQLETI
ncbi:MAG: transcription termination/antitermination protein NusG [Sphingobacteriaceae bacterium]